MLDVIATACPSRMHSITQRCMARQPKHEQNGMPLYHHIPDRLAKRL
jgi:hypothetical protein